MGCPVDLVVLAPARLDELVHHELVEAEGRRTLGTLRLGFAVRIGAPRPAIATEADIWAALLAAPAIGLANPASGATTGIFFAKFLGDMGLTERLRPRVRLFPGGDGRRGSLGARRGRGRDGANQRN